MNLDVLARNFYAEHCVGCSSRRPTGEVPNLASVIEADAAAHRVAAERVRDALNRQHHAWESRAERRRASRVGADPVTASVLDDFGVLDMEPGSSVDPSVPDAAIRRLTVLAERRPDAFSNECIDLAILLIETDGVVALLAPLRRATHARPELVPKVLAAL